MTRHPQTPLLNKAGNNYSTMKVVELKDELDKRGITYNTSDLKSDLILKLEEDDLNAGV
ncbi:SAP domain-containing protein [Listeria marthii]|uniref:SAP domain-containing protein n=1 Tax=Listeria marthii TaxID=529731 RepID=UPI0035E3F415